MLQLKIVNVGIISLAKILGVLYGLFGLIVGFFIALSSLLGIQAGGEMGQAQAMGPAAIIILPVIYALIGAISGLISAFFFNLAAKWMGPLEVNVAEKSV
jgi:hypothetical protein